MAKHELLNNIQHSDLRVNIKKDASLGDAVGGTLVFPEEFIPVHKEYPIYFQKSKETGEFQAVALFGFARDENLFLDGNGWHANYIPALMRREPFLIGFQSNGQPEPTAVIHIDMENPRVNPAEGGERVFLENGGNTPFLEEVSKTLMLIHQGLGTVQAMFKTFLQYDLIEPFTLDITFDNGSKFVTDIYYTINREKLYDLDDSVIVTLHKTGYLQLAYIVLESLSNIKTLIAKKNQRLRTQ